MVYCITYIDWGVGIQMKPYYQDEWVTIYHGDCRKILPELPRVDLVLTDPPYGIGYHSSHKGILDREIVGDIDTSLRDEILKMLNGLPMIIFGSRKVTPPKGTRMVLIWDKQGALGMGALDLPWKPSYDEIYIIGKGFHGRRGGAVLSFHPCQATAWRGRKHPHEKPYELIEYLITKSPLGLILDPFLGSGTTAYCAKKLNRKCIGIEIEEKYCEIAAKRCSQSVMRLDI